jgi:hypothetical protein
MGVRRPENHSESEGDSIINPKRKIRIMAMDRRTVADMPIAWTRVVRVRVKKVKLTISPRTTPRGRRRPFEVEDARMIGRTGRTHGEMIVQKPAKKEKTSKRAIVHFPVCFHCILYN